MRAGIRAPRPFAANVVSPQKFSRKSTVHSSAIHITRFPCCDIDFICFIVGEHRGVGSFRPYHNQRLPVSKPRHMGNYYSMMASIMSLQKNDGALKIPSQASTFDVTALPRRTKPLGLHLGPKIKLRCISSWDFW